MRGETSELIVREIDIAAEMDTVFGFFIEPEKLTRWLAVEATLDPRPGGVCRITITDEAVMLGEFVELVPHSRVVVRWGWEQALFDVRPASTEVEFKLSPEADGTLLQLTHRQLPPSAHDFHRVGWGHFVKRLSAAAGGEDPGRDQWVHDMKERLYPKG
jgi:uncharacterized protein YndB with AHSA1/START domain